MEPELFETAQKMLANSKKAAPRKKPREESYFSGFLMCGGCGHKLATHNVYKTRKDGTESVTTSYLCRQKSVNACTTTSSISYKKVERVFEEYIARYGDFEVADEIQLEAQKQRENSAQIKAYQSKLHQLETKERESMAFYVEDKVTLESYPRT